VQVRNEVLYVVALKISMQDLTELILLKLPRIKQAMVLKEG